MTFDFTLFVLEIYSMITQTQGGSAWCILLSQPWRTGAPQEVVEFQTQNERFKSHPKK